MMIPSLGGWQLPLPVSWNAGCGGNGLSRDRSGSPETAMPVRSPCSMERPSRVRRHGKKGRGQGTLRYQGGR